MATKRALEERVAELEEALEEARGTIQEIVEELSTGNPDIPALRAFCEAALESDPEAEEGERDARSTMTTTTRTDA